MVITLAKLRIAHASMHGARKQPRPKNIFFLHISSSSPKYRGKQIFKHGRFQKWVKSKRRREKNNGLVWRTQSRLGQKFKVNKAFTKRHSKTSIPNIQNMLNDDNDMIENNMKCKGHTSVLVIYSCLYPVNLNFYELFTIYTCIAPITV